MKTWNELSRVQKIMLGLLILTVIILIPESGFLLDVGGVDLVMFLLVMYSQNIKLWFDEHLGMITYPTIDHSTFIRHTTVSTLFLWMTGSVVLAYGFFLVLMFMRGV